MTVLGACQEPLRTNETKLQRGISDTSAVLKHDLSGILAIVGTSPTVYLFIRPLVPS